MTGRKLIDDPALIEHLEAFMASQTSGSVSMLADRRQVVRAFLRDTPGWRTAADEDVEAWLSGKPTARTRTNYRSHVRRLYSWARDAGLTDAKVSRGRDPIPDDPALLEHVAAFMRTQTSTSPVVLLLRRSVVRAFLRDTPGWLTAADEDVEAWLNGKPRTRATRTNYRGHIRKLYVWAREAGLTDAKVSQAGRGPGTARTLTGMNVSLAWQAALVDWMAWLRASGMPATTLGLRRYQILRLAQDSAVGPFEVTGAQLVAWLGGHEEWAAGSKRSYRSTLRSFYGWAMANGAMLSNPGAQLPPVRQPIHAPHPTPEEVWQRALQGADERTRLMILLGCRLGLRRGEICKLHTRDVVTSPLGWSLQITGKGRRERVLPLVGEIQELLAAAPAGYLFPGQIDGHLSPAYCGKLISASLGPGWSAHSLRHRFATAAYAGQRDLFAVQSALGHSRPETTAGYVALPDDSLRAAMRSAGEKAS